MKKLVLFFLFMLCTIFNHVHAYDCVVDGIYYNRISVTEVEVTNSSTNTNGDYSGVIVVPETISYMGNSLKVTAIGNEAFKKSSNLTSVQLPKSITSIGDYAFYGCKGLVTINLPIGITEIKWYTFYNCTSLLEIDIPNSVTSIGLYAFSGCSSLNSVTIPSSVVAIGQCAFAGCTSLAEIMIPNSVKTIEESAFKNCTALADVNIGNNVESIKQNAFASCSAITSIKIPDSVKSIEASAFSSCYNLENIILGSGVSTIGSYAFFNCSKITKIYSKAVAPPSLAKENSFGTTTYSWATVYVPNGSLELYQSASYWNSFIDMREFSPSEIDSGTPTEPTEYNPDTDISSMNNVIYLNKVEASADSQINLSIRMKNTAAIRGFQFDIYLPEGVTVVKSAKGKIIGSLSDGRLPEDDEHSLTLSEQGDGAIRFLCGSLYDETFTGNDGEIATLTVKIAENINDGDHAVILRNIKLTETDINNYYQTDYVKSTLTIKSYTLGDINSDQKVDVSDYIGIANHILGNTPEGFVMKAADVNEDGLIDVSDYIGVANIILTGSIYGGNANAPMMYFEEEEDQEVDPD